MTGSARRRTYDTSTDPSRGGLRREVASALGLLVVFFNLLAGILVASSSQAGTAPFLEETFGDRIVICTGAGMIVLDAEGNPIHSDSGVDPMCVFCLPMVAGSADTPSLAVVLDAPRGVEPEHRAVAVLALPDDAPAVASTSPRGPPLA